MFKIKYKLIIRSKSDIFLNIHNKRLKLINMRRDLSNHYSTKYDSFNHIEKTYQRSKIVEIQNVQESNYGTFNESYYGMNSKQYQQNQSQNNTSDLSLIIYEGLDEARKITCSNQLLANMEQTYKKQLQLQIELCKQLQGLTMMHLLKEKETEVKEKVQVLQEDIRILRNEMKQIQTKLEKKTKNNNILGIQRLNSQDNSNYHPQYNVVRVVNGKIKIKRQNGQDLEMWDENTNNFNKYSLTLSNENHPQNLLKPRMLKQSQNFSTSPSRCTSYASSHFIREGSCSPKKLNERKLILIQRINIMKEQLHLALVNADKKRTMMSNQISLLKKQIFLTDECLAEHDILEQKKSCITPKPRKANQGLGINDYRNRRQQSHDRQSKDKRSSSRRIFNFKTKINRPSMFQKAKQNSNASPQLQRYRSQDKFTSKYSFLPEKSNFQPSNMNKNLMKIGQQNIRHQYFDHNNLKFPTRKSRECKSRFKNCYYY